MGRHTVFGFQLERTEESLTAHGGLAVLAEFTHRLGVCGLTDRYRPSPGSNRGYAPSVFVHRLMLQAEGQRLEDLRELTREDGLLRLLDRAVIPDPDTVGDWLRRMGNPQTGHAGLLGLGQVRDALTVRILRRDGHETATLDADATLVVGEQRTAQWSDTGVCGDTPLLGFLWETPVSRRGACHGSAATRTGTVTSADPTPRSGARRDPPITSRACARIPFPGRCHQNVFLLSFFPSHKLDQGLSLSLRSHQGT